MRVKICGIKTVNDALKAIELGADAIGLLVGQVHVSSDFITKEAAKKIVAQLPPLCSSVLVTHFSNASEIIELIQYTNVDTAQLHCDIEISEIKKIRTECPNVKLIKAVHVLDETSISVALQYENYVDAILLDTYNHITNQVSGTGMTHDWDISKKIIKTCSKKVIIAGGLNYNNILKLKTNLNPYGVDINSGVKDEIGTKDYEKMRRFINNAKNQIVSIENDDLFN